jgi:hypothetical protein
MRTASAFLLGTIAAAGIAVLSAPPASAGCQSMFTPWGGGQRCDGPIDPNGFFQRCDSGGAMGFTMPNQCYMVDSKNLGNNPPWIP